MTGARGPRSGNRLVSRGGALGRGCRRGRSPSLSVWPCGVSLGDNRKGRDGGSAAPYLYCSGRGCRKTSGWRVLTPDGGGDRHLGFAPSALLIHRAWVASTFPASVALR